MFCYQCGMTISKDSNFCMLCKAETKNLTHIVQDENFKTMENKIFNDKDFLYEFFVYAESFNIKDKKQFLLIASQLLALLCYAGIVELTGNYEKERVDKVKSAFKDSATIIGDNKNLINLIMNISNYYFGPPKTHYPEEDLWSALSTLTVFLHSKNMIKINKEIKNKIF